MSANEMLSPRTRTDHCRTDWGRHAWLLIGLLVSGVLFVHCAPNSPLRAGTQSAPSPLGGEGRGEGLSRSETASGYFEQPGADTSNVLSLGGQEYRATTKNIEDITDADIVLAKNPDTGELVAKPVVQSFRRVSNHLRVLHIRNADGSEQTIETTNQHPFWVSGSGWVEASKLAIGDSVTHSDGLPAELIASTYEPHPEGIPVYNFEVADLHCYYVSASPRAPPLLAHNADCSEIPQVILNLGGEGEVRGVLNVQGSWVRSPNWGSARAGETLVELQAKGHKFVIADNMRLPFKNASVDVVLTNGGVPIDVTTWLGPGVQSREITRILKPGGQWIEDGFVRYVK